MSTGERFTIGWIGLLIAAALGTLFFPSLPDFPKNKDWVDVASLAITAASAVAAAAAAVIALYIPLWQVRVQEVQAHKLMVHAASGVQYKLEGLIEACNERDALSLEARFVALENIDRELLAVRGELFTELADVQSLIRMRDVTTQAVALVRIALSKDALRPFDLRARLMELRSIGHAARWSMAPVGTVPLPLGEMTPGEHGGWRTRAE